MKKTKKLSVPRKRIPDRASELLVNQRMLYAVRDELKADIRSHDRRFDSIDAKFDSIDAKFDSVDARFDSMDARFDSMDARFDSMDKKFDSMDARFDSFQEKLTADMRYIVTLVEEQRNLNNAVLDGYHSIYDRQDRVEKETGELRKLILEVKKSEV